MDARPVNAGYRMLTMDKVRELAAEGSSRSTELVVGSHLSLTGTSGKAGLYMDEVNGDWYQPIGTAPSTHIIKQSHIRLKNIIENEQLCLRSAAKLGIETAESFIVQTGSLDDAGILLATRRYDRSFAGAADKIGTLTRPRRLHQEDFAQALGIASVDKYEKGDGSYLEQIFTLVRNVTSEPLKEQLRLLDLCIFNVMIGNTDAHIKNLSLLYGADLSGIALAPAYDLLCTQLYKESTSAMAFAIAGEREWGRIIRNTFVNASADIGISPAFIRREYDRIAAGLPDAVSSACTEMRADGSANCERIRDAVMGL